MKLKIFDTNGTELNIGDLVQIQEKRNDGLTFYSRVQVLNGQLYPFNKFAYDRIFKIDEIPADLEYLPDKKLQDFLKNDSVRQLLHISYGSILKEHRKELYQFLFDYREDHCQRVEENIEKHLKTLGSYSFE